MGSIIKRFLMVESWLEHISKHILVSKILFLGIATQRSIQIEAEKSCCFNGWLETMPKNAPWCTDHFSYWMTTPRVICEGWTIGILQEHNCDPIVIYCSWINQNTWGQRAQGQIIRKSFKFHSKSSQKCVTKIQKYSKINQKSSEVNPTSIQKPKIYYKRALEAKMVERLRKRSPKWSKVAEKVAKSVHHVQFQGFFWEAFSLTNHKICSKWAQREPKVGKRDI